MLLGSKKRYTYILISILSLISFFLLWEVLLLIIPVSKTVLIPPTAILKSSIENYDIILEELLYTISEIVPGWIIGNSIGFLLAIFLYKRKSMSKSLITTSVLINSIPLIALSAIIGGFMGLDKDSKILIVSIICFFPIFITTLQNLSNISDDHLDLLSTYSSTEGDLFRKIRLPKSLPYILNTLKTTTVLAIFTAISSEFFGGYGGIGIFILTKKCLYNLELVWASILYITIFGAIFYFMIELIQKISTPWNKT